MGIDNGCNRFVMILLRFGEYVDVFVKKGCFAMFASNGGI